MTSSDRGCGEFSNPGCFVTFDDFLEFFYARLRKYPEAVTKGLLSRRVPPGGALAWKHFLSRVEAAHVFLLGEEEKMMEVGRELAGDAIRSMNGRLPMPFDNLLLVWRHPETGWFAQWLDRPEEQPESGKGIEFFAFGVFSERMLKNDLIEPPLGILLDTKTARVDGSPYTIHLAEIGEYLERRPEDQSPEVISERITLAAEALTWAAAISHPYVYVIDSQPILAPRDERLAKKNGRVPDRKRPRYIVVDLPGFYELRDSISGNGSHASPIPHERRGHWRRLAERCTAARAEGKERVFVRPTVVGNLEFTDGASKYKVILNPAASVARAIPTP